ncbi:MAG: secretin N-terminal domain-containing protein [Trueperaceae bacterium]|nr:secretin N-terminal domain-containing protein [Trueperaceae bacterium]
MKRRVLLLTALLALVATAFAQTATLPPDDPRFDQPVALSTDGNGEALDVMVAALARAVGLTPIVDGVSDTVVRYDVSDPKPFRQVWALVMSLHDLDYVLDANDVIVVGPPDALAGFRRQVGLPPADGSSAAAQVEQRVYELDNASADALADVLRASDFAVSGSDADAAFTVAPDARTNALIVTAAPRVQTRIAELLPTLDREQPQVAVNVRIQEVNRSVVETFGLDLTAARGNVATTLLDTGLEFLFDAQRAIADLNVVAVLDTLESQNLARRVDESTLTVLNNEPASLRSGGELTLIVTNADGDPVELTVDYGVNVTVTPRVAADGRITLAIEAGISDLIEESPTLVNIADDSVNSTVTVDPGQTVLMGGLFESTFTRNERRIPVLGRLPAIGGLFGTTETDRQETELLLIVRADRID